MRALGLAILVLGLAGCASSPTGEALKAEIASYQLPKLPQGGTALVYVVRPSSIGTLVRFNVFLNDQAPASEVGFTRGGQYIYFAVPPGEHKIYSKAENWAEAQIRAKPGDILFLQQDPRMGVVMSRNTLSPIDGDQGRYYVKTLSVGTLIKPDYTGPALASAASAGPFATPLPNDLSLHQPAPQVPAGLAGLIGAWSGQWTNGLDHTLVVEKIDERRKARLVYSWGVAPGGGEPGFTRVDADLTETGVLRASLPTGATIVYRLSPDGRSLAGEWLREGRTFNGTFERLQIDGLALKPYVAPKAVKAADFSGSWIGRFQGGPRAVMTIENIQGRTALLVYSLEVAGVRYRGSADTVHGRTEAALADDGSLQATLANGAKVVYRVADDGSLAGEYVRDDQRYQGRFRPPARNN